MLTKGRQNPSTMKVLELRQALMSGVRINSGMVDGWKYRREIEYIRYQKRESSTRVGGRHERAACRGSQGNRRACKRSALKAK
jgi:hypothetical protein